MLNLAWKNRGLPTVFLLFLMTVLVGCGGKATSFTASYGNGDCQQLWVDVEEAIHRREVADNMAVRVQGFPYLRSTRFLEALAALVGSREEENAVLEEMRLLDLQKRSLELSRIPRHVLNKLGGQAFLDKELPVCSQAFLTSDKQDPDFFKHVRRGIDLDKDYSLWLRSVGLYPLTALLVDYLAENAQAEMVGQFRRPAGKERSEDLLTFRPPTFSSAMPELSGLLRRSRSTPLLSLNLAEQDVLGLVHEFAPLLTTSGAEAYDRFGRIVRKQGTFTVDGRDPVVYYYLSQTLVQGIPALQINYAIWFSERAKPAPWYEQGAFDGLLFRVTLNWQGQPVFVDVSFQCGCYHFVLFNANLVNGSLPDGQGFQPFSGGKLPELKDGERLHFGFKSGWHQIDRVEATTPSASQQEYELVPYESLEYFVDDDQVSSLFDKQGLVPGSNRLERFFLFAMGIPKVGAMRQRGRQPITLIGRAYFDDPYLFDRSFRYQTPLPDLSELIRQGEGSEKRVPVPRQPMQERKR